MKITLLKDIKILAYYKLSNNIQLDFKKII